MHGCRAYKVSLSHECLVLSGNNTRDIVVAHFIEVFPDNDEIDVRNEGINRLAVIFTAPDISH